MRIFLVGNQLTRVAAAATPRRSASTVRRISAIDRGRLRSVVVGTFTRSTNSVGRVGALAIALPVSEAQSPAVGCRRRPGWVLNAGRVSGRDRVGGIPGSQGKSRGASRSASPSPRSNDSAVPPRTTPATGPSGHGCGARDLEVVARRANDWVRPVAIPMGLQRVGQGRLPNCPQSLRWLLIPSRNSLRRLLRRQSTRQRPPVAVFPEPQRLPRRSRWMPR